MYRPKDYDLPDPQDLWALVDNNPFAILVSAAPKLWATHLPLFRVKDQDGRVKLIGHMAKANRQWRLLDDGDQILVIFQGPHAYITPTLYVSEPDVPTWNYDAVHVEAKWFRIKNEKGIYDLLKDSVDHFESQTPAPWSLEDLDKTTLDLFQSDIVAFHLEPTNVTGVRKMGQDKSDSDLRSVSEALENSPNSFEQQVGTAIRTIRFGHTQTKD